jgi:DNA-binding CsgD family transcriptional regulator
VVCVVELTPKERKILKLIFSGKYRMKDVAEELVVSYEAIRTEMNRLYKKYGTDSMPGLILRVRHEDLQKTLRGLPIPPVCECGERALWRSWVVIRESPAQILMCDRCRVDYTGKVEPVIVLLTAEQYGKLIDLVGG